MSTETVTAADAAEVERLRAAVDLLRDRLQETVDATKELLQDVDVIEQEIRRAVRLSQAGDVAAAMRVVTKLAAGWLDSDAHKCAPEAAQAEQERAR